MNPSNDIKNWTIFVVGFCFAGSRLCNENDVLGYYMVKFQELEGMQSCFKTLESAGYMCVHTHTHTHTYVYIEALTRSHR